jgi:hypothetical protein
MVAKSGMLAAIGFDDQTGFYAGEIDDAGRYRELASKAPAKLALSEFTP